jgi:hypothetical protein
MCVIALVRHTTERCELQCSLRLHSMTGTEVGRHGNGPREKMPDGPDIGKQVVNPASGVRVTVQRLNGRGLLRRQKCRRGTRENWRTRARGGQPPSRADSSSGKGTSRTFFVSVMRVPERSSGKLVVMIDVGKTRPILESYRWESLSSRYAKRVSEGTS